MHFELFKPNHSLTDEQLMQRVSDKDDDKAFDELYHRHVRRLMGFFFRQTGKDEALSADLTQDAFMRIWTNRDRYQYGKEFLPWLFTIAYNLCKNLYRLQEHQQNYETLILQTSQEEDESNIELTLDGEAFTQALGEELKKLSPQARLLFSLRFEENLSVPQIAVVMEIPEGTVKSRLHKLTNTLKRNLKTYEDL